VSEPTATRQPPLEDEIGAAEAACRAALAADCAGLAAVFPQAPATPEECFDLLNRYPDDKQRVARLGRLAAAAERAGVCGRHGFERYVALMATLAAFPRLRTLDVDDEVKRQYCAVCHQVIAADPGRDGRFAFDSDPFDHLARMVTLRRLPAGQICYDVLKPSFRGLLWWALMVHPLDLPRWIRQTVIGIGRGFFIEPHLSRWRARPDYMLKGEQERSFDLVARAIERDPRIKGFIAVSWLYSPEVGANFPHLAWVRDQLVDNDAYEVDLTLALPEFGFLVGSEKRRRLHAEGKFHPRQTFVLWRRDDILAWAKRRREQAGEGRPPPKPARQVDGGHKARPSHRIWSGEHSLIDCKRFLFYHRSLYALLTVLLPALAAAALVAGLGLPILALPVFIAAVVFMWLFQYFFLQ